ncbi:MAG: AAA family ATPase [Glaciecola sp.]|nr:AAA family ATPase [Glaciecola sp.]
MKILSVLIENLNSLQGKWVIDFTAQAFVDNGLFAITGPTGAGKSTILDAISIALYHETPRLSSLSKTNAEVMNKDKGYCSAEVRFEVQGQIYLAKWSIRRSRNRADGNLQAPTGTLTCETTQTDITTKLSDKVPAVVALTKLNFKRFTKSMMLSQGEFSAFLNAGDNDRSELLEQLTGTEIYSDISKRVFDEHKVLKQRMALLTTEQSAKDVLSEEDKAQLIQDIAETQTEFTAQNTQLTALVKHQHWWQQHAQYSTALDEANHKLIEAQTAKQEQQSQLARLELARPAHKLTPLFQRQIELQRRCDLLQTSLDQQHAELPVLTLEYNTAATSHKQTDEAYQQQLSLQTTLTQLVNEHIIPLDTKIAGQHAQMTKYQTDLDKTSQIISKTKTVLQDDEHALSVLNVQFKDVTDYLTTHQTDSLLAEHIGVWKLEYATLQQLTTSYLDETKRLQSASVNGVAMHTLTDVQSAMSKARNAIANALAITGPNANISAIVNESTPLTQESLTTYAQFYQAQIHSEQALLRLHGQWEDANSAYAALLDAQQTLHSLLEEQQAQLPRLTQQAQSDATILELAKNNMSMQQQLASYSHQLSEAQSCPLCASSEFGDYEALHAHTNEQAENGTFTQQLANYQRAQQASSYALEQLTQGINTQKALLEKNTLEQNKFRTHMHELHNQCIADAGKLNIFFPANGSYRAKGSEPSEHIAQLSQLKQLPDQLAAFDHIRLALAQLQQYQALVNEHQALAGLEADIQHHQQQLLAAVHQVGFTQLEMIDTDGNFAAWLRQKDNDLTKWQSKYSQQQTLAKSNNDIAHRIALNQQIVSEASKVGSDTRAKMTRLQEELTAHLKQREALFENQDPKQAMREMNERVEQLRTINIQQSNSLQSLTSRLATLNSSIQKDSATLDQESKAVEEAQTQFKDALNTSIFATEGDFIQACVSEAELEQLNALENQLNTKLTQTLSVLNQAQANLTQHLSAEQAHDYQTASEDEVNARLTQQQQQFSSISEKLGQLKGQLSENEKRELAISTIKTQIDALHEALQTYGYLDELIGSSDGKKFRKFAQGLTLDNLIYLANLQLVDFDGRYELKRKDNQSLDMVVVDRWQGDTERDTRTLSGGESFLVSLALALGLSDLVSQEISIDSLFLDEGFGTLDSDTLDTALDVLDTLNAKGKMIGVISHVEAMKQRIPLQIKITKQSGLGISTLDEQYRYTESSIESNNAQ